MTMKRTTGKRILGVLLTLLMILPLGLPLAPTASAADDWDGTWDGSGFSNNHITSAKGFAQFINNAGTGTSYSGQTVYLDVDIDLKSIDFGNISGGKNVYYSRDNYFQGTFDGQGHTIYNFQMHNSDHRIGIFRSARNATFKNFTVDGIFVDDNNNNKKNGFAVVVGYADNSLTFENVHLKNGIVYGYSYVGGLVGELDSNNPLTITNCSNTVTIHADNNRAGGLVGHSKGAVYASNCSNTGEVYAANADVGGIVGWIEDDPSSITNCTNEGTVNGKDAVGGILGYFGSDGQDQKMILTGNVNRGNVTASENRAGGIAGHLDTDCNSHEITGNVNYGNITGGDDTGGIIGRNKGFGVWTNNKNYGEVYSRNDNAGGIVGEIEDDKQVFTNCTNVGYVHGKSSIGGIVGWLNTANENEFTRCFNTGTVASESGYAGGIAGRGSKQLTCTECFNIGNIQSGGNDTGGLVGSIDYHTFFNRCFNAGNVTAPSGKSAGGLIGYTSYYGSDTSKRMIDDCYNWGTITAENAGGLVGYVNGGKDYKVEYSYNTGTVNGSARAWSFVGYGGSCGSQCFKTLNTGSGTYKTPDEMEAYDFSIDSYFCKNTWGVRIGSTTYKYPILNWYRDMFSFQFNFVDSATGTNETILKNYGESFTVPNPTRSGYSAGQWLSGNTHRLVRGSTVTAGNTYLTNTNYDKNAGPADTNTVVQSFTDPTEIRSTKTYGLTWKEGAAANMYAMAFANETSNAATDRFRAGIDYTIYNLSTGHDTYLTVANGNSSSDWNKPSGQYFKSFQATESGGEVDVGATATLEVDRSKFDDIKDTGVYVDYYPFIYTAPGGVRWGIEIFDPNHSDSKGVLNNDHWTATVTGTSGKSYTYEQRFNDVNGSDHRCAEPDADFTHEPMGQSQVERRYGSYKWYFKGAAPDVGDSVTLRITAICAARHNSGNLQILSEWTDLTITGTCTHANGHLHAYQANAATCTEAGNSAYWYCDVCQKYFSDAAATHEIAENSWILPATNHAWGQPTYVWTADNVSVTATRVCANDPTNHVETETVRTTSETGLEPTCTEKGKTIYTAVFTNPAFATQTKTVEDIDALQHDWNTPTYVWSDDGHTVTATRTCNNGNHPETETVTLGDGITSAVKTPANCSVMGTTTYTATFTNAAFTQQTKDVQDIPTNDVHDWNAPTYEWSDDGHTVTATRVCTRDGEHVETETRTLGDGIVSAEKTPANCSVMGTTTYTATFTNLAFAQQTKDVQDIPTNNDHAYGEPTYVWSDDGHTCTATRVCARDGEHVETETATLGDGIEAVVKTPANCEVKGTTTYTATFENPAFKPQTKDVQDIPTNDVHDWNDPTYEWSDDGHSITATRTCKNGNHPETETLTLGDGITSAVKTPANCNVMGTTTYTATFTNPAFLPQTKDVQDIPTNDDHDFGEPTYEWSDDGHTITATRVCARNSAHVETEELTLDHGITSAVKTPANCNVTGTTTYTATFTNPAFLPQTKDVQDIPTNDDHDFGEPTYEWAADGHTITATRVCARNSAHVETETLTLGEGITATVKTPANCNEKGWTTYTATFENPAFKPQTKDVQDVETNDDHAYGEPTYEWADDGHTITATRVCARNSAHVETETLTLDHGITSAVKTPANCNEKGWTTYTATFENPAFKPQTKDVQDVETNDDHAYGEPTYEWADDGHTVTATRVCARNDQHVETEELTLDHGITSAVKTPANCSVMGWTTYTATFTNPAFETQTKDVQDIATNDEHSWNAPTYAWAEDYSSVTATRTCANGDHPETETVGTDYAVVTPAQCGAAGVGRYTAKPFANPAFTAQTRDVEIPALSHAWGEPTYTWAADNSTVTAKRVCANGDHPEEETVIPDRNVTVEPTCFGTGEAILTATFENPAFAAQTKTVTLPKSETHEWDTEHGTLVNRPTCTEPGVVEYRCRFNCGATKRETVEALGHDVMIDPAIEPTCTERGVTEGSHCLRCGRILVQQIVISSLGHDYGAWTTTAEPTCAAPGSEQRVCARCDYVDVREIPSPAHTWGEWEITTEPGCETFGEAVRVCAACGTTETKPVAYSGHTWVKGAESTATCTEAGVWTYTCSACGATREEPAPALGHDWTEGDATTATCTEPGTVTYVCSRCGETRTEDSAALGHDWGEWEIVREATREEDGLARRACARCGETQERAVQYPVAKSRSVQFVASQGLSFSISLGAKEVSVTTQSAQVLKWYPDMPLHFTVKVSADFRGKGYTVFVNQKELAPDADGGFTLPAGSEYVIVSITPVLSEEPTPSGGGSASSGVCKLCGKNHNGSFWGRIVGFVHAIIWFFRNLFK